MVGGASARTAGAPIWGMVLAAGAVFVASAVAHVTYVRRRTAAAHARIQATVDRRDPSDGPAIPVQTDRPAVT